MIYSWNDTTDHLIPCVPPLPPLLIPRIETEGHLFSFSVETYSLLHLLHLSTLKTLQVKVHFVYINCTLIFLTWAVKKIKKIKQPLLNQVFTVRTGSGYNDVGSANRFTMKRRKKVARNCVPGPPTL